MDTAARSPQTAPPPTKWANPELYRHKDLLSILSKLTSEDCYFLMPNFVLSMQSALILRQRRLSVCLWMRFSARYPHSSQQVSPLTDSHAASLMSIKGHETTSSAVSWTLYALARAPDIQKTLRAHIRSIPFSDDDPTHLETPGLFDSILHCEYLDHVVREALRLHAPVTSTMRVAGADDIIPVARPFLDRRGQVHTEIHVKKGDIITIPIQAMNKDTEVWGDDATKFWPERWAEPADGRDKRDGDSKEVKQSRRSRKAGAPGLWSDMLTFGNGNPVNGNRACIGFQFAVNEWVLSETFRSARYLRHFSGLKYFSSSCCVTSSSTLIPQSRSRRK